LIPFVLIVTAFLAVVNQGALLGMEKKLTFLPFSPTHFPHGIIF